VLFVRSLFEHVSTNPRNVNIKTCDLQVDRPEPLELLHRATNTHIHSNIKQRKQNIYTKSKYTTHDLDLEQIDDEH
jgi:hypothetical protein